MEIYGEEGKRTQSSVFWWGFYPTLFLFFTREVTWKRQPCLSKIIQYLTS